MRGCPPDHPDEAVLRNYLCGGLTAAECERAAVALAACPACADQLDQLAAADQPRLRAAIAAKVASDGPARPPGPGSSPAGRADPFDELIRQVESTTPYKIGKPIGKGGQGRVYAAAHRWTQRLLAIKFVLTESRESAARAELEQRTLRTLRHPRIVTVLDCRRVGAAVLIVMDYVAGQSLADVLERDGTLSVQAACDYALGVLDGLCYLAKMSFVHRDLKPGNLIIESSGAVKIVDFGLAKDVFTLGQLGPTAPNVTFGTAPYMAPEQFATANVDIRADLFSLGATLYHLLTGCLPFEGESWANQLQARNTRPRPPRERRKEIPYVLSQVVMRLLEKSPAARYQTPQDVVVVLAPFGSRQPMRRPVQRSSLPAVLTVTVVALVAVAVVLTRRPDQLPSAPHSTETRTPPLQLPTPPPALPSPEKLELNKDPVVVPTENRRRLLRLFEGEPPATVRFQILLMEVDDRSPPSLVLLGGGGSPASIAEVALITQGRGEGPGRGHLTEPLARFEWHTVEVDLTETTPRLSVNGRPVELSPLPPVSARGVAVLLPEGTTVALMGPAGAR